MNRRNFILGAFAATAVFATPIAAQESRINEQLMLEYVGWIVSNSDFEYQGEELPSITFLDTVDLQKMQYSEERFAELTQTGASLPEIVALYDRHQNQILFNTNLDFDTWKNDHVIVHELVHYLQMVNQTPYNCSLELEPEAYALQIQWQDEVGHPGERPDAMQLLMLNIGCSAL